jgi:hypothetical protein
MTYMHTLTSRSTSRRRWAQFLGTGAAALVTATTVAAVAGAATTPANFPVGASGSVAALAASSMEVQNPSTGQTTVSWTPTTTFSKTVTESVSAVAVGDCVTVTGTTSKSSKTTVAARSITITTPSTAGTCTRTGGGTSAGGAFGGPGGFRFRPGANGTSGTRPSFPAGAQRRFSGSFPGGLSNLAIASGKVTGVSGSTISVSGIDISPGNFVRPKTSSNSKSAKSKRPVIPKTETLKVTTTGSTTVTSTQATEATDLALGDCVSAFGPAATNGAVTATTVRITSTGGASCTGGFGGGGGFFGGGGFGGGGGGGA